MNYVKLLKKDTGLDNVSKISTDMEDHDDWRERRLVELVLQQGKARARQDVHLPFQPFVPTFNSQKCERYCQYFYLVQSIRSMVLIDSILSQS